jgi:hypothetical protein
MTGNERTDYSVLLGFVAPTERIDPHVRVVDTPPAPDLREVVEIVRDKRADQAQQNTPAGADDK